MVSYSICDRDMQVRIGALTPVCGSLEPYDGRERPEGMQAGRKVRPQGAAGITRTAKAGEDGSILIDNSSVSLRRCAFIMPGRQRKRCLGDDGVIHAGNAGQHTDSKIKSTAKFSSAR